MEDAGYRLMRGDVIMATMPQSRLKSTIVPSRTIDGRYHAVEVCWGGGHPMPGRIVVLARPQPFPIRNQCPATQIVAGEVSDTGRTVYAAGGLGAPIDANESIIERGP